jgi:hypothetical protein
MWASQIDKADLAVFESTHYLIAFKIFARKVKEGKASWTQEVSEFHSTSRVDTFITFTEAIITVREDIYFSAMWAIYFREFLPAVRVGAEDILTYYITIIPEVNAFAIMTVYQAKLFLARRVDTSSSDTFNEFSIREYVNPSAAGAENFIIKFAALSIDAFNFRSKFHSSSYEDITLATVRTINFVNTLPTVFIRTYNLLPFHQSIRT